jgi:aspartate ammonia-lyase
MRSETDLIGSVDLPDDALYGIHSMRASLHFPDTTRFHKEWYQALGTVKKACYLTSRNYVRAVKAKYTETCPPLPLLEEAVADALIDAAGEIEKGMYFDHFIVPAIQGGAGTSANMNINEIIANISLLSIGHGPGDYQYIDPILHANIYQSTNDVIPTSLRVTLLRLLQQLEPSVNSLRMALEEQEKKSHGHLRVAYTQMQEAVPSSYGRLFSTYNDALSRDWWRISKCSERIKTVNLGGSAIGTGITVPRYFIREVVPCLRQITGLPLARAENLQDATCNMDSFVEIHAVMKAHAVNLEKIVSDLRLLSSDLVREKEVEIPSLQAGSSIMPGKINPVIPEFIIGIAHKVYSNDQLITGLCAQGCLDLNAYLPVTGHAMIESIKLLIAADNSLCRYLVTGMQVHPSRAREHLLFSPAITTALLPFIGYHKATLLATEMKSKRINILEANRNLQFMTEDKLTALMEPSRLLREGFTMEDIMDDHG